MAYYQVNTNISFTSPSSGLKQDLGQRYVTKDYLLDVYPNLSNNTISGTRTSPGLFVWGENYLGQMGIGVGASTFYSSPIQVGSLTNWKFIAASYNTFAIKTDGTLWGWGDNTSGSLGNSTVINYSSPIQIGALSNWSTIATGNYTTLAVKTDGSLWGWGSNAYATLGNSTTVSYSSPIQIGTLTNWKSVISTYYNSLAVKADGTLWSWGQNQNGSLGLNTSFLYYSSPVQVGSLTNWKSLSAVQVSVNAVLAIKTDGSLWGWGDNSNAQLGNGSVLNYYSSPIQIGSLTNWKQVVVNSRSTLAIKTDGTLWAWGSGFLGALGNGTSGISYSSPIQVGTLTNWKYLAGGGNYAFAIKTDGTLWSWGFNNFGGFGIGVNIAYYSSPIQIGSLTTWKQITLGVDLSAAIIDGVL